MRKSFTIACAALALAAPALQAQAGTASNWAGAYVQMYTGFGAFDDPDTNSRWAFSDNAFGIGASLQRDVAATLLVGLDVGYARPSYERTDLETDAVVSGDAGVLTALASGRIAYGGTADLGFYLTGGAGTIAYHLEDVGGWNADLALRAGTGLEYRMSPNRALYLEWGRLWGYHEKEGVSGGKATHSVLKLGLRVGF